jgi:hypothetical protein
LSGSGHYSKQWKKRLTSGPLIIIKAGKLKFITPTFCWSFKNGGFKSHISGVYTSGWILTVMVKSHTLISKRQLGRRFNPWNSLYFDKRFSNLKTSRVPIKTVGIIYFIQSQNLNFVSYTKKLSKIQSNKKSQNYSFQKWNWN